MFKGVTNPVCDPLASQKSHDGSDTSLGLAGTIYYVSPDLPHFLNVAEYQANGTILDATMFMGDVNIPTRKFDLGFATEGGQLLSTPDGSPLYEYFSLHLESTLQLATGDEAGNYQFAVIADDGAVLKADAGRGFETVVDNDGTHASKLACSQSAYNFGAETKIPMQLDYYQGPRYHVALVLLWRKVPANATAEELADEMCGQAGSTLFFNPDTSPSTPAAAYNGMLDRGWRPVSAANFKLPGALAGNPCNLAAPATSITGAKQPEGIQAAMQFTFESDHPASVFICSLDGAPASPCLSGITYADLASGNHTFVVRAQNDGRLDPVGATHAWTQE
ncbi:MAG: hypothetical protein A2583_12885 [Bdellovibrionales bacterium RIFOXYD1_FULL_53_11]|nr:MAG: hypothetical protein A2583_12885 [Bdellovibrionales bacterium RIFOXYD1_FULL_53_11]